MFLVKAREKTPPSPEELSRAGSPVTSEAPACPPPHLSRRDAVGLPPGPLSARARLPPPCRAPSWSRNISMPPRSPTTANWTHTQVKIRSANLCATEPAVPLLYSVHSGLLSFQSYPETVLPISGSPRLSFNSKLLSSLLTRKASFR